MVQALKIIPEKVEALDPPVGTTVLLLRLGIVDRDENEGLYVM